MGSDIFNRSGLLLGSEALDRLSRARVVIFGLGGVGSWCAEGLVRSGVTHLTVVDDDVITPSNVNRQLPATSATIGRQKSEAMRDRLIEINPDADIVAVQGSYSPETSSSYDLDSFDYVIDAIDTLGCKAELILKACDSKAVFFSSMGAALKLDPTKVRVSEFWDVNGCSLAAALRRKFRHSGVFPSRKFQCVWSPEALKNQPFGSDEEVHDTRKVAINGSMAPVTATFGMTLASMVIRHAAKF